MSTNVDKPEKKKRYRYNFGRIKLLSIIGAILYTLFCAVGQQSSYLTQLEKKDQLENEHAALERELEYYENEASYIGTDEYVEQEARTRLGWLKPNEIKYVEGVASSTRRPQATAFPSSSPASESSSAGGVDPTEEGTPGEVSGTSGPEESGQSGDFSGSEE